MKTFSITKFIVICLVCLILIPIFANIYSVSKLYIANQYITKAYFTPYYYAKLPSDRNVSDIKLFVEYMEKNSWELVEQMGGEYIFKKNNKEKRVLVSDIKTIFK